MRILKRKEPYLDDNSGMDLLLKELLSLRHNLSCENDNGGGTFKKYK